MKFVGLIIALALFVIAVMRVWRTVCAEHGWLPRHLARGRLLYSEHQFRSEFPLPLVARVDRAYLVRGVLHLLELKTRKRAVVYRTDVIELSVQRMAVTGATANKVSLEATVLIENPETRRRNVRTVKLLTAGQVAKLFHRRAAILAAHEPPREARSSKQCMHCEYRRECKGEATARVVPVVFRRHPISRTPMPS